MSNIQVQFDSYVLLVYHCISLSNYYFPEFPECPHLSPVILSLTVVYKSCLFSMSLCQNVDRFSLCFLSQWLVEIYLRQPLFTTLIIACCFCTFAVFLVLIIPSVFLIPSFASPSCTSSKVVLISWLLTCFGIQDFDSISWSASGFAKCIITVRSDPAWTQQTWPRSALLWNNKRRYSTGTRLTWTRWFNICSLWSPACPNLVQWSTKRGYPLSSRSTSSTVSQTPSCPGVTTISPGEVCRWAWSMSSLPDQVPARHAAAALTFPSEASQIAYVITQLTDRARMWGTAVWKGCQYFGIFADEMQHVFDRSKHNREAVRELLQSREGRRSISDVLTSIILTLATLSGRMVRAQVGAFLHRLSEEVLTRDLLDSFVYLIRLAVRVDSQLQEHRNLNPQHLWWFQNAHLPLLSSLLPLTLPHLSTGCWVKPFSPGKR